MGKQSTKRKFVRKTPAMPRRRVDMAIEAIDFKNTDLIKKYVTERGKILPRRLTGLPAPMHRRLTRQIKRARAALLCK